MRHRIALIVVAALTLPSPATAETPEAREARADSLVAAGRAHFALGDFGHRRIGLRLLGDAALLEPRRAATLEALGRGYLDAGFNHLARVAFEKAARYEPRNADAWYGLAQLYKRNWLRSLASQDFDRAMSNAEAAVRLAPGHAGAAVLLAVLRVERGAFAAAAQGVEEAVAAGSHTPELQLVTAYLAYRSGDAVRAESLLARVRQRLAPDVAARFDDVAPMLGLDDAEAVAALGTGERAAYARRFWAANDPDPTTELNEAVAEYHARVAHALLVFTDTWNPRWDMRAALYVRFGAPAKVTFLPVGVVDNYRLNKAEVFWTSPDGASRREITQPMYLPMNVQVWEYPQYGMAVEVRDMVLSQSYEMPRSDVEVVEARVDTAAVERNGLATAGAGRAVFASVLPGVRRRGLAARVSRFVGADGPRVLAQVEMRGSPGDTLVAECVVLDSTGARVARAASRPSPSNCDPAARRTADFSFDLPAGHYRVAFAVEDAAGGRGVMRTPLALADPVPALALSDIVPVCGPYSPGTGGGPVRLAPNVDARVSDGGRLHAYFEVYGLATDSEGLAQFDLVYEVHDPGGDPRPWYERILGGKAHARISVRSEEASRGPLRRQFIQVPVTSLRPGKYRLDVSVHDRVSGGTATRSLEFVK